MGETIQLKAADGFSFSAYVTGPANATKGRGRGPGDLWREPPHS